MLEIKDKELVRTRIEEALKAIETLRDILLDANMDGDFLTLNILAAKDMIRDIALEAEDILNYQLPEPKTFAETRSCYNWAKWASEEFPKINVLQELHKDAEWEISHSAKEV